MTKDMQVKHQEGRGIILRQLEMEDIPLLLVTVIGIPKWGGALLDPGEHEDSLRKEVRGVIDLQESEVKGDIADHSQEKGRLEVIADHSQVHLQQMEPQRIPLRLILTQLRGKAASTRATLDKWYPATR